MGQEGFTESLVLLKPIRSNSKYSCAVTSSIVGIAYLVLVGFSSSSWVPGFC